MSRDDYERSKKELPANALVADLLREHDIPVPAHLDEIMAIDVGEVQAWRARQADASRAAPREVELHPGQWGTLDRRAALLSHGWPLRAVEHAEKPHDTAALQAIRSWRGYHNCIVLAGTKGCGKTVSAAWHALTSPMRATMRFLRTSTLLRTSNFESGFGDVVDAPALCLDDLGAEYADAKGYFAANLDELIDTYYGDRRPLIITTNLDGKTFAERYGSRVHDRLKECADWASIIGSSLRSNDEPPPWER